MKHPRRRPHTSRHKTPRSAPKPSQKHSLFSPSPTHEVIKQHNQEEVSAILNLSKNQALLVKHEQQVLAYNRLKMQVEEQESENSLLLQRTEELEKLIKRNKKEFASKEKVLKQHQEKLYQFVRIHEDLEGFGNPKAGLRSICA